MPARGLPQVTAQPSEGAAPADEEHLQLSLVCSTADAGRDRLSRTTHGAGCSGEWVARWSPRGRGTSCLSHLQECVALAVADLVALSQMLLANLVVREAHNLWLKGDTAGRGRVLCWVEQGPTVIPLPPPSPSLPPSGSPADGLLPVPGWSPAGRHVVGVPGGAEYLSAAGCRVQSLVGGPFQFVFLACFQFSYCLLLFSLLFLSSCPTFHFCLSAVFVRCCSWSLQRRTLEGTTGHLRVRGGEGVWGEGCGVGRVWGGGGV